MINTFTYTFDEIPLVIVDGTEAGLVSGEAEIEYSRDGEWLIAGITLQGSAPATPMASQDGTQVECPPVIAAIIDERLNKEYAIASAMPFRKNCRRPPLPPPEQRC